MDRDLGIEVFAVCECGHLLMDHDCLSPRMACAHCACAEFRRQVAEPAKGATPRPERSG